MGYPNDFQIPVSDTQAYRQFGNSVVVPVIESIADAVVSTLNKSAEYQPDLVLTCGDKSKTAIYKSSSKKENKRKTKPRKVTSGRKSK